MSETPKIDTVFDDETMHLGEIYAKALLSASEKQYRSDTVAEELESFVVDVLDRQPALEAVLVNPKTSTETLDRLIDKLLVGRADDLLVRFFKVLARRGRLGDLRGIQRAVSEMRDASAGRIRAIVTTAQPMDPTELNQLKERLGAAFQKNVSVVAKVDANILGGLVVRIGDVVYDGSIDGQLKQLRKSTLARTEQVIRDRIANLAN